MIFADKLIYLRKKFNITQEELASQIDVSRQSISKWESAMSMPDINKIIKVSQVFGVSTDFLLNDNLDMDDLEKSNLEETYIKSISMEEANTYLNDYKSFAKEIFLGMFAIILAPCLACLTFFFGPQEKEILATIVVIFCLSSCSSFYPWGNEDEQIFFYGQGRLWPGIWGWGIYKRKRKCLSKTTY